MSEEEAMEFSRRQAVEAARSIPMSIAEMQAYADAVLSAIHYFNERSKEHEDYVRYVEECRKKAEELERQRRNKPSVDIVVF